LCHRLTIECAHIKVNKKKLKGRLATLKNLKLFIMNYLTHAECICMAFEEQSAYPPYGINDCNGKLECPEPDTYIQRIARELQEEHRKGCKNFIIQWNTVRGLHIIGE